MLPTTANINPAIVWRRTKQGQIIENEDFTGSTSAAIVEMNDTRVIRSTLTINRNLISNGDAFICEVTDLDRKPKPNNVDQSTTPKPSGLISCQTNQFIVEGK